MTGDNGDNEDKGLDVLEAPEKPAPAPQKVTSKDLVHALQADTSASESLGKLRSHLRQEAVAEALGTYKSLMGSTSDKVALQAAEKILNLAFGEDEVKGKKDSQGGGIHFHLGTNEESSERTVPPGEIVTIDEEERHEK